MKQTVGKWIRTALSRHGSASPSTLSAREAYDRWANTYRRRMNVVQRLEEDALLRLLPNVVGKHILDVGCGTGRVSMLALERGAATTTGIDISSSMLDVARARSGDHSRWVHGDACALPFDRALFDVVICALVLGHIERLDVALFEMDRVLKPGGVLLITGFHPFATLRGAARTFHDPVDDSTYAIAQHVHLFEEYFQTFRACGWSLDAFEEPRYEGYPVIFIVRAQKGPSGHAGA